MGFQPSAFDLDAGDPAWSPYWDHFTYAWKDDGTPRVFTSETEIHEARDAGELDEFPGMPDTNGEICTVNCPVPVLAPVSFELLMAAGAATPEDENRMLGGRVTTVHSDLHSLLCYLFTSQHFMGPGGPTPHG